MVLDMRRKKEQEGKKPKVNQELKGFNISINSFGEIISDYDLDKINGFLDRNVDDKKLRDREDIGEHQDKVPIKT
jgi:hypothetical protein